MNADLAGIAAPDDQGRRSGRVVGFWLMAVLCLALSLLFAWRPVRDTDAWYHLAVGRWILEHHSVPTSDFWTFTAPGRHWITHEWLYEVLLYCIYSGAGLWGLVFLKVLLTFAILFLFAGAMESAGRSRVVTVACLLLVAVVGQVRFIDRPQLFSLLGMVALIWLFEPAFRKGEVPRRRLLWGVVGGFWLWGNLHAGVVFGLWIAGAYCLDYLVGRLRSRQPIEKGVLLPFLCMPLAALVSPNHIWVPLYPLIMVRTLQEANFGTGELAASTSLEPAGIRYLIPAMVLLWAVFARPKPVRHWVIIGTFAILGFQTVRERPAFFLAALPLMVSGLAGRWAGWKPSRLRAGAVVLAGVLGVWLFAPIRQAVTSWEWNAATKDRLMPSGVIAFHRESRLPANVFNVHAWGGFLNFRAADTLKVFIDPRLEVFPPSVLSDYLAIEGARPEWKTLLTKYGVHCLLVDYDSHYGALDGGERRSLSAVLFSNPEWALVYWDDAGMIYLSRQEMERRGDDLRQWTAIDPNDLALSSLQSSEQLTSAARELEEHGRLHADSHRSRRLYGHVLLRLKRMGGAAAVFAALPADVQTAEDVYARAYALDESGNPGEALAVVREGLERFAETPELLDLGGILFARGGSLDDGIRYLERAARLAPPSFERESNLARMYQDAGEKEKAEEHLKKARELEGAEK